VAVVVSLVMQVLDLMFLELEDLVVVVQLRIVTVQQEQTALVAELVEQLDQTLVLLQMLEEVVS
jgi:hypothetical protein